MMPQITFRTIQLNYYLLIGANAVALNATRHATRAERRKENFAMVIAFSGETVGVMLMGATAANKVSVHTPVVDADFFSRQINVDSLFSQSSHQKKENNA